MIEGEQLLGQASNATPCPDLMNVNRACLLLNGVAFDMDGGV